MTGVEIVVAAFALSNGARVLAYLPQILCIAQDENGANAVSRLTWGLFAISHLATVAYALTVVGDLTMAAVFGLNLIASLIIIGMTTLKRYRARARPREQAA